MADLTITAASVVPDSSARITHGIAGATIAAGQSVALDPTTNTYKLADSNSATAALKEPDGVALNSSAAGQPLAVAESGSVTVGAVLTAGKTYFQSDTPGGICPEADVGSGEVSTIIGTASSTSVLKVRISRSGVTV